MARLKPEFDKRNCKIIGLSVDQVGNHSRWAKDIEETQGYAVNYPMIGDPRLEVAKLYDMLPAEVGDTSEGRTAADNATVRAVFVIWPDKKIKAMYASAGFSRAGAASSYPLPLANPVPMITRHGLTAALRTQALPSPL
jgi:alkyl hydroperoxide reductase subunit AhpC